MITTADHPSYYESHRVNTPKRGAWMKSYVQYTYDQTRRDKHKWLQQNTPTVDSIRPHNQRRIPDRSRQPFQLRQCTECTTGSRVRRCRQVGRHTSHDVLLLYLTRPHERKSSCKSISTSFSQPTELAVVHVMQASLALTSGFKCSFYV